MAFLASFWLRHCRDIHYLHFTRESISALTHASTLLIAFHYTLSNCSTQTLCNHKNDSLVVAELLKQIRTCSLRFNLLEWASTSKSLHDAMNNCGSQALCTGKKSIRLNGLFYVWWCMSCIILRLQQQMWLLVLKFSKRKLLQISSNGKIT